MCHRCSSSSQLKEGCSGLSKVRLLNIFKGSNTYTCTYFPMFRNPQIQIHIYIYTYTHTYTYLHPYRSTDIHIHIYTSTCTHKYTYIHTHISMTKSSRSWWVWLPLYTTQCKKTFLNSSVGHPYTPSVGHPYTPSVYSILNHPPPPHNPFNPIHILPHLPPTPSSTTLKYSISLYTYHWPL